MSERVQNAIKQHLKRLLDEIAAVEHDSDFGYGHFCYRAPMVFQAHSFRVAPRLSTICQVDECLDGCEALLRVVTDTVNRYKRQRNRLIPLHGLPAEVFNEILRFILGDPWISDNQKYYSQLLPLRLISSQWNNHIIDSGRFWTFLPVAGYGNRSFITLAIQRSTRLPLYVSIRCYPTRTATECIRELVRHSPRWKALVIAPTSNTDLRRILAYPTPNLKSFAIHCDTGPEHVASFPVFMGDVPKLDVISLRRASMPWYPLYFERLQKLELDDIRHNAPTFDQLIHIIRAVTRLRELRIHSSSIPGAPTSDQVMAMGELRTLHLTEVRPSIIWELVDRIASPKARDIFLRPSAEEDSEALIRLAHHVAAWLPSNSGESARTRPFTCRLESESLEFQWAAGEAQVLVAFRRSRDGFLTLDQKAQICSVVSGSTKPTSSYLHIGILDDDSGILETLLAVEKRVPHVTRIFVPEARRERGARGAPLEALGRPREVEGTLRWLYPEVVELGLQPWASIDVQIPEMAELVKARWIDGVPGVDPPAALKVVEVARWVRPEAVAALRNLVDREMPDVVVRLVE